MEKIFHFFQNRNVNYVQIKPCPFLAPSPATSYKGAGTAKGPELTFISVCQRLPDALVLLIVRQIEISPSYLDRKDWENAEVQDSTKGT